MLKLVIAALLLPIVLSGVPAQQLTLEERIARLTKELNTSAGYVTNNPVSKDGVSVTSYKVENARYESCTLRYDYVINGSLGDYPFEMGGSYKVPLTDLDADSFSVEDVGGIITLLIHTKNKKESVDFESWTSSLGKGVTDRDRVSDLEIPFQDRETAERVGKVFARVVASCVKGKK